MTTENSQAPLVLVTGASKGIGRAIALDAAKAGYDLALHYGRDQQGAQETLNAVQSLGQQGHLLSFDLANRAACRHALEADIEQYGMYYGIVLNAAAYTHTSVGIGDAVKAIETPVIEVHISNTYSREEFRYKSYISANAKGIILGFGLQSYELAIQSFI